MLAARFDVVAPMFPGFGDSDGIEQIDDMEDATFHLLDLLDRLELDRPILVGVLPGGLDGGRGRDPLPRAGRTGWCS